MSGLTLLSPTTLLVALFGVFWLALIGAIWPHPARHLPLLVPLTIGGALLGQAGSAGIGGIGPAFGDLQLIGIAFGSLLAIAVVRRLTA